MRTQVLSSRAFGVLTACALIALTVTGCSGGSSSDSRLEVVSFNLDGVSGAFLNERLIFTFNSPIDPDSVDIQTIAIRYDASQIDIDGDCAPDNPANRNAVPDGDFLVEGNRVIFQPRIPSSLDNNDVGLFPMHNIDPDGADPCNRATPLTVTYTVTIPGFSSANPVTVVSLNDQKPVVRTFNSTFTTLEDLTFPPDIDLDSFVDLSPGAPTFTELVSPVDGATDVALDSAVEIRFSEALLPSSVTNDSIYLAGVGPRNGREERIPSTISLDQIEGIVILEPQIELPGDVEVRVIFTEDLLDFGGNSLTVGSEMVFPAFRTVDAPTSGPFAFQEGFDDQENLDAPETSALWGAPSAPGLLVAGLGGGTAAMGSFEFDPTLAETMTFDTGEYNPAEPIPTFDFSTFRLGPQGTIQAIGENPLIIRATQDMSIEGRISVTGADGGAVDIIEGGGGSGGEAGVGGGAGGSGGSLELENGGDGAGSIIPGSGGMTNPGGGAGSVALACVSGAETGGGGGGAFFVGAQPGAGDDGNPAGGGLPGMQYGVDEMNPFTGTFFGGSGGGGGGATCVDGIVYPGAGGGAGGGALWIQSAGEIDVAGDIFADGGAGGANNAFEGTAGGAGGGGGSGGAVLLQGIERFANGFGSAIRSVGGAAGEAGESGSPDGSGGAGSFGRIRVESNNLRVRAGNFMPSPSRSDYSVDGNTSVGTSSWFDTGAFFPDYTFSITGRNGGTNDQDNANLFPDPSAIEYWFQGAPPHPQDPTMPDLENVRPGVGEFARTIDEVDDSRFIRVKVVMTYPFPQTGVTPTVNFFTIGYTFSGGTSEEL